MNSSKKRMAKAVERTVRWFDEQIIAIKNLKSDVNGISGGTPIVDNNDSCTDVVNHHTCDNSNNNDSSSTDNMNKIVSNSEIENSVHKADNQTNGIIVNNENNHKSDNDGDRIFNDNLEITGNNKNNRIVLNSGKIVFFGVAQYNPHYPVQIREIVDNIIKKGATGESISTYLLFRLPTHPSYQNPSFYISVICQYIYL